MEQPNSSFLGKKEVIYLVAGLLILLLGLAGWFYGWKKQLSVSTQKIEYAKSEKLLRLNIKNYTLATVCFSSCYPYYIQKKDGQWKDYPLAQCEENNIATDCVDFFETIGRGIDLDQWRDFLESDSHRLALPACIGCNAGDPFRADKTFYSNEFKID
ncbi:MAG: hypothetical protein PHI77_03770 [Candidatus Pacebacteria bacterium]|nr:hypothetical protein [Candidatus Paceibacterota bacterium]MDD4875476.1 hypothetical protein [Candidatus Paceibacterota bacterium]